MLANAINNVELCGKRKSSNIFNFKLFAFAKFNLLLTSQLTIVENFCGKVVEK